MSDVILEMKNISKSFGLVKALDDVSIDLRSGEVLALMGENGAGKSTLMNILSGSLLPDTGEIYIHGQNKKITNPVIASEEGICKIHQELQIVPELNVAENIFLGRWKKNGLTVDFKTMKNDCKQYLEMLNLEVSPDAKLKDLRIGEQQLIEIAKALSLNSDIIVMDEPTSAISEKEADRLFEVIRRLRGEGKAIIYISHRMEEIFKIADRITVMRDGRYIDTLEAAEATQEKVIRLMVGREMSEQFPKEETTKGDIALEVKDLTYSPPADSFKRSLKNINLYVRHGEVLGIAGLVGAGRSEFFECVAGLHSHYMTGTILVDGKPVVIKKPKDAIDAGISFATEDRKGTGLVLQRSIGENITLPLLKEFSNAVTMDKKREADAWERQISELKVKAPGAKTLAGALSGGNQQKVVLARWLLTKPKILLLDEPTRGIDVGAKAEIYQLINSLAGEGMAIIVISSELPEVIGISDRIVTFCEGELTGEFTQKEATQEKLLSSATRVEGRENG
ncbi:MAG: sugar ABC transporter ATP-binding protein [Lachnospiraceae bacterium]|nr:sugar ABC transporter ATP-binding protein [Lachnospiraceae bacterium]